MGAPTTPARRGRRGQPVRQRGCAAGGSRRWGRRYAPSGRRRRSLAGARSSPAGSHAANGKEHRDGYQNRKAAQGVNGRRSQHRGQNQKEERKSQLLTPPQHSCSLCPRPRPYAADVKIPPTRNRKMGGQTERGRRRGRRAGQTQTYDHVGMARVNGGLRQRRSRSTTPVGAAVAMTGETQIQRAAGVCNHQQPRGGQQSGRVRRSRVGPGAGVGGRE